MTNTHFDAVTAEMISRTHAHYDASLSESKLRDVVRAELDSDDGTSHPVHITAFYAYLNRTAEINKPWLYSRIDMEDRVNPMIIHAMGSQGSGRTDHGDTAEFTTQNRTPLYHQYSINAHYNDPENCSEKYPPDDDWTKRQIAMMNFYEERCGRCRKDIGQDVELEFQQYSVDDGVLEFDEPAVSNADIDFHLHHIQPLDDGGKHALSNLIPLCIHCHSLIHPTVHTEALTGQFQYAELYPHENGDPRVAVERTPNNICEIFADYTNQSGMDSCPADDAGESENPLTYSEETTSTPAEIAQEKDHFTTYTLAYWEELWKDVAETIITTEDRLATMNGETVKLATIAPEDARETTPLLHKHYETRKQLSQ